MLVHSTSLCYICRTRLSIYQQQDTAGSHTAPARVQFFDDRVSTIIRKNSTQSKTRHVILYVLWHTTKHQQNVATPAAFSSHVASRNLALTIPAHRCTRLSSITAANYRPAWQEDQTSCVTQQDYMRSIISWKDTSTFCLIGHKHLCAAFAE